MSKEIVKQDIIQILQSVIEQTETINQYKGRIPQIEIDLIQENIRQLYQNYYYLNILNQKEVDSEPQEKKSEGGKKADQKVMQEKEQAEAVKKEEEAPDSKLETEGESEPELEPESKDEAGSESKAETESKPQAEAAPKPEPELKKETEPDSVSKSENTVKQQIEKSRETADRPKTAEPPKTTKKTTKEPQQKPSEQQPKPKEGEDLFSQKSSTLADKLQHNSTGSSLYDHISKKESGTLEDRLKKKPVDDIKTAIGINEKFLFINELFKGNMHDYNNAIKQLNRASGMEEAAQLFDQLKEQYGWDADGAVTLQLLDFVERKHS